MTKKKQPYSLHGKLRATGHLTHDGVSDVVDIIENMPINTNGLDVEVVIDDSGITLRKPQRLAM